MSQTAAQRRKPQAVSAAARLTSPVQDEELDQMLAPIALYPDPLLSQVFIAATYPLEVVQATRWQRPMKSSPAKLTAALEKQSWDPSVKAMVQIPSVLQMMSDKLEWTQKLGTRFWHNSRR